MQDAKNMGKNCRCFFGVCVCIWRGESNQPSNPPLTSTHATIKPRQLFFKKKHKLAQSLDHGSLELQRNRNPRNRKPS